MVGAVTARARLEGAVANLSAGGLSPAPEGRRAAAKRVGRPGGRKAAARSLDRGGRLGHRSASAAAVAETVEQRLGQPLIASGLKRVPVPGRRERSDPGIGIAA